ncbi:MAG TPA: bifunctional [glutamate--ammonia ligase]-adenylyl-L-tyrosine phosphorylase/[glutamate--ammonia-ligase] adenylyltransferase [Verrucomicrobiae bacterium]|nr:bifunctional [glutamate--ammonia ligase]-adenylyl-L-tyrosine phosphorylase/[glutamate--ammonia-ligase] adenylyltransferase [Verrucomicrobiae bacterium]
MAKTTPVSRKSATRASSLSRLIGKRPLSRPATHALLRHHGFRDAPRVAAAIRHLYEDEIQRRNLARVFPHLMHTCEKSADADRALVNFARLVAALPNSNIFYHYLQESPDRLELLIKVFAHSQALADTLTRNAAHLHFLIAPQTLEQPREKTWLAAELTRLLLPIRIPTQKYDAIRRFRRRETLRIGARDLIGRASVEETTMELSNLADVCLQAVFEIAREVVCRQLKIARAPFTTRADSELSVENPVRIGVPAPTDRFAIIGMGKLGGQELNYSSDVDVIFVYGEEGQVTPTITNHQFFTKLAEEIIRAVGAASAEGNIFRIDLRLRPEGATGPLVRSLESFENYYAEFGETWERMALIKARCVAGDAALGAEFVQMVQPFVYARHAAANVIQQMAALKKRIENEIVREDRLTRHVKLGIGGIREIEFIVQSFQVLRGARLVSLRERSTLRTLSLLGKTGILTEAEVTALADAYRFLRNVEHRLQMEMELQTHTIPDEEHALYRLARSLGFLTVESFFEGEQAHTAAVRKIYESVLAGAGTGTVAETAETLLATDKLPEVLTKAGFADVPAAMKVVENLWQGPGFGHLSARTKELFVQLFPTLLDWAHHLADPDAALARFDKFVAAYGSRGLLFEIFANHPKLVEMLMRLGDASRYLSDVLARQPELFDAIGRGVALSDPKNLARMQEELRAAQEDNPEPMDGARHWKQSEMLRIGIEDIMGLVDLEHIHTEVTALAETCLRFAVERSRGDSRFPFAVIGMGKFGGQELGYGADLDVLFVTGHGANAGDPVQAGKLATSVIDFMSRQTSAGTLFAMDARLRPDGAKGPLASSLEAHRDYYVKRAEFWERQALIKARFVAGDAKLGKEFLQTVHGFVYGKALTPDELKEMRQMRHRIETERGDQKHVELEFKTGPGGLVDVEFLVQKLQLQHGPTHPQLRTAHTLAALNRLTVLGFIDEEQTASLRRHYTFLRRIESTLRRMENTSVSKLPVAAREQEQLSKRLGFALAEDFLDAYRHATKRIREIYEQVLNS